MCERTMPFSAINPARMSEAVTRQVETLILRGVLKPGDRLPPERELAERMEVSRPTLREALGELEDRGLIETTPGGGTHVSEALDTAFSAPLIELFATHDDALFDYIALRRDLEGLAAERAAEHATQADLAVIDQVFRALEAAARVDARRAAAIDAEFHMALVEASHNVITLHVMRALYDLLVRGVFYNRDAVYGLPDGSAVLLGQHREIRDAVLARDGARARAAVEAHLDYVAEALRQADRRRSREEIARLRQRQETLRNAKPKRRKGISDAPATG